MSGRPAPVSRKQRLMAAVGERTAGGRRRAALLLYLWRRHRARRAEAAGEAVPAAAGAGAPAQPFFPFLQQEPAPGARELSPADGCVLVCAVCRCFLGEQWGRRARTPVDKRMYWLKRPHQCDAGAGGRRGWAPLPLASGTSPTRWAALTTKTKAATGPARLPRSLETRSCRSCLTLTPI